MTDAILR